MSLAEYLPCAAINGWTLKAFWVVRYLVLWDTGCSITVPGSNGFGYHWERRSWAIGWWLVGMSSIEMCCTIGGACNLGAGGVPGVDVGTLGELCFLVGRVRRGRSVVAVGDFVSPAQCSMLSWRALMALSYASTVDAGLFLSAAVSSYTACRNLYYGVTEGRASLWCLNSMVSDNISVLVSLDTTFWQR